MRINVFSISFHPVHFFKRLRQKMKETEDKTQRRERQENKKAARIEEEQQ
jgi:hypothetical protein